MKADHLPTGRPEHLPSRRSEHPRGASLRRVRPRTEAGQSRRSSSNISILKATETWVASGRSQGFSEKTLSVRMARMRLLCWWLETVEQVPTTLGQLSAERVRRFLTYCREPNPDGRFGNSHPMSKSMARPSTVFTWYRELRAFCNFCLQEELLNASPLRNIKAPRVPLDQVKPFTDEQVAGLLKAAAQSFSPERNRAIVLTLLDTGLRVSELCSLKVKDAEHAHGELTVIGKGGKSRTTYLGVTARRALKKYLLRYRPGAGPDEALFTADAGHKGGEGISTNGVQQVIRDLGQVAQLEGVRCSPHTLRHTFAVSFLRGGGNLFELQRLMGHTGLTVLRRYVALAESDLARAHQLASPADRMGLR